jgi:exodeoxyribonuclease VII large subunit
VAAKILDALAAPLADGAHVVVHAKAQLFPRRGSLSLAADDLRPVGIGELLARLEHLRRVLAAEGIFAAERKRPLPFLPRVVGLISGRASAAERDVVENARRRWPGVRFDIRSVAVQGPNSVPEVVAAVEALDGEVDVIVIARGGGSLEDLLPFSNEALVRAVAACRTPVVSAIGHEVDSPLLDLVADVRASTPTDAGKRIVPDVAEELSRVAQARARGRSAVLGRLEREERLVADLRSRPALADPVRLLDAHDDQLAGLRQRARACVTARLHRADDDLAHLRERVAALSPAATLARGYAVVQDQAGAVLRAPEQVEPGDRLRIRLHGGTLAAVADDDGAATGRARTSRTRTTGTRTSGTRRGAARTSSPAAPGAGEGT